MSRNFRDRLCRKSGFGELEGDRLAGARGQQTRACIAVQKAARADMMADPIRSVLRRRFGSRLCGIASEAQRVQAQERGKIILCRGRDLRGRQYGRGKLQAKGDEREQATETRPPPPHFRRPRPHRVDYTSQFDTPQLNLSTR